MLLRAFLYLSFGEHTFAHPLGTSKRAIAGTEGTHMFNTVPKQFLSVPSHQHYENSLCSIPLPHLVFFVFFSSTILVDMWKNHVFTGFFHVIFFKMMERWYYLHLGRHLLCPLCKKPQSVKAWDRLWNSAGLSSRGSPGNLPVLILIVKGLSWRTLGRNVERV